MTIGDDGFSELLSSPLTHLSEDFGLKQFLLFPPETASMMYTNGEIEYVHKNGRIVYKGQVESLKSFLAMHKRVMSWQMDQMLLM